jgi:hypothetical protein
VFKYNENEIDHIYIVKLDIESKYISYTSYCKKKTTTKS